VTTFFTSLVCLSTNAAGQLQIFAHDGDTFGVDSNEVRILEEACQVSLRCLL
jgi:hypothetical protein